jgi:Peptidase M50B-like
VTRHQLILIVSTLLGSWIGMQAVHEAGHVLAARLTGGRVERVVVHPLTISRTDLSENPSPLVVAWAGPLFGVATPLVAWGIAAASRMPGAFVLRFFAGFCLIANGLYIGVGSFDGIGDSGDLLRHGSPIWHLWLFAALTAPAGLWLWHRQGPHFGLATAKGQVHRGVAYVTLVVFLALLILGFIVGRT